MQYNMIESVLQELKDVRYGYHVGVKNNLYSEDGYSLDFRYWDICTVARPHELVQHGTGCCIDQAAYTAYKLYENRVPWSHIQVYTTLACVYDLKDPDKYVGVSGHFVTIVYYKGQWSVLENTAPFEDANGVFSFKTYNAAVEHVRKVLKRLGIGTKGFDMENTNASTSDIKWFAQGGMTYIEAAKRFLYNSSPKAPEYFRALEEWISNNRGPLPTK
jgi:hypothetical protein